MSDDSAPSGRVLSDRLVKDMMRWSGKFPALTTTLLAQWRSLHQDDLLETVRRLGRATEALDDLARQALGRLVRTPEHFSLADQISPLELLTSREVQILKTLAEGRSTTEIAEDLRISPSTVRSHVKSLLAKLGAHSRIEAVALLHRHDQIQPSTPA